MLKAREENNYYAQTRPEMLEFIPRSAKRILEIGCGQGLFANLVKKNRQAEIWGVEKEPSAARLAENQLEQVLIGDVFSLIDKLPDNYFDCLVFNDVLEHLIEPFLLLDKLKSKLVKEGVMVFSVPNVRYFLNLKNLMINKQWRYEEAGVLDKTHLRFFTKKSLIESLAQGGFDLITIKGINPISAWQFNLLNLLFFNYFSDTRYLQWAGVIKIK